MENIKISGLTIKQVRGYLLERGFDRTHIQIWEFFKTKGAKGIHYNQEFNGGNLEIKEEGVNFYIEFLETLDKFKNKSED